MMRRASLLLAAALCACAPRLASLRKPERVESFTLEKDHVRQQHRGLFNQLWVEGLRAGTYTVAGEDDNGRYFVGEGAAAIVLSLDAADRYLKTGEVALPHVGGLWLPKPGVDQEPKLFSEFSAGPVPTNIWEALAQGDVLFVGYGSEQDFITRLRIVPR